MLTYTIQGLAALDPAEYLPMARTLLGYIAANMESGLGFSVHRSIQGADIQMPPEQRLYDVELRDAAILLQDIYPQTTGIWLTYLRNYMGYRIVEPIFCAANMKVDPVTRACVPISGEPVPLPVPVPIPPPLPPVHIPPEREAAVINKKWLYLGVGLALVLLLRK